MITKRKPNQTDRYALADALRHARAHKGWTIEGVAEQIGRSTRWVQALELGQGNPNWLDTIHLFAILEIDPLEFALSVNLEIPEETKRNRALAARSMR